MIFEHYQFKRIRNRSKREREKKKERKKEKEIKKEKENRWNQRIKESKIRRLLIS